MTEYEEMHKRLDSMDDTRRFWITGFIEGLAYVQAQDPTVDDRPIKVDFPSEPMVMPDFQDPEPITVQEFVDVWHDLDDEGGILDIRFTAEQNVYLATRLKVNLVSTEGDRGIPDAWDDPKYGITWLTVEEAQRVLDASRAT